MSSTLRRAGLAAFVIAAMAVGQVITDHVEVGASATASFVRTGLPGAATHLSYADITVEHVRAANALVPAPGQPAVVAGGVFLILDVRLVATHADVTFAGTTLLGRDGIAYRPTTRAGCQNAPHAPAGVPWFSMLCFDVPPESLPGATLVIARGSDLDDGQRRDDVAHIGLGIMAAAAADMAATDVAYTSYEEGFAPGSLDPVEVSRTS